MNQNSDVSNNDEVNLLIYWKIINARKWLIGIVVGSITVGVVIWSLLSPITYRAEAVIMPVSRGVGGGGLAATIGQFGGGLASLVAGGGQGALQQFMALLITRTLAEDVVTDCNLVQVFEIGGESMAKKMDIAVRKLNSHVKITDDRRMGTIKILSEFDDPALAARVANSYLKWLQSFINRNSFAVAKRNRIFIEYQLDQNKQNLLNAGKELNEFYKNERVSSVESKVDVVIESSKDMDFSDINNLIVSGGLTDKVADLQKKTTEIDKKIGELIIVNDVPQQVYLQYLTLRRKLLEEINTLLTQQYEVAKIEEAKEELAFQTIDPAREPVDRFKPKRKKMVVIGFFASLFLGIIAAFFVDYVERMKKNMELQQMYKKELV